MAYPVPSFYYNQLGRVESGNNPNARSSTSSASGTYQFTKPTWEGLGYDWKDVNNADLQNQAVERLTQQNATRLQKEGVSVDPGSLYAAHFLGAPTASRVYSAPNDTSIDNVVGAQAIAANPNVFKNINTVGDFKDWSAGKMGVGNTIGAKAVKAGTEVVTDWAKDLDWHDAANAVEAGARLFMGDPIGAAAAVFGIDMNGGDMVKKILPGGDDGEEGILKKLLKWLKELFSANTAARFAAIVIGIVLIGGAIWALVNSDKVIQTVKEAAPA